MITVYVDDKAILKLIEMKDLFEGNSGKNIRIEFIDAAPLKWVVLFNYQERYLTMVQNEKYIIENNKLINYLSCNQTMNNDRYLYELELKNWSI